MKFEFNLLIVLLTMIFLFCNSAAATNIDYNYTLNDDFNKGNSTGLNVSDNQVQLSDNSSGSSYSFIWIPNSNEGTVSKVNTITGMEVARYHTGPDSNGNPSRTTIDLDGSCWLGNRQTGTAIKIGLLENGGYIDRNNDGIIETSRDLDGNGAITSDEILPWGQDECVLYEVILISGYEGTYTPGNYSGPYANDYYTPGPRGLAVDSKNNVWIGTFGTMKYYYVNGSNGQILKTIDISSSGHTPYGALMDQYGILWSSGDTGNNILRIDPLNDSFTRINLPHTSYGLAIDRNNHLFVSGLNYYAISCINILTGSIEWIKSAAYAQGITVTDDGDIWSANNAQGTVTRYSNNGDIKATIIVGNTPTGVSVDSRGKVWAVDNNDEYIHRINPNNHQADSDGNIINGVELSKRIIGGTHYGYSDMTGVISNTITTQKGIWTVIHDSEVNNVIWGQVSWNSYEPNGTKITVRVRSSNNKIDWSEWENVTNDILLDLTPRGRFIEIETTLERFNGNISPLLYDLNVRALTADVTLINTIDNPTPKIGDTVRFVTIVTNNGPDLATNLRIYPVVPAGFTIEPPTKGYFDNNVWIVGNLNPGEIAILEVKGNITSDLTSRLVNYTSSETHNEYDPNQISTSTASFYVPVSNIELVRGTENGRPTLFVRNNGPDHAFNLGIQTKIPHEASSATSQGFYSNGLWYVGALSSGAVASLNLIFQTSPVNTPINPVSGYKTNTKISVKNKYSTKSGIIPPPNNKTIPMQDTGLPINFSAIAILFIFFASYLSKNNNKIKPNKWLALFIILFFALLFIGTINASDPNQTYNSTDDFNKGVYNNVNGSNNKLELPKSNNYAQNYIWVPNTNEGTISKVDVRTGQEVARYRTSPRSDGMPSAIAVDNYGNCFVANVRLGSIVKIGLYENGAYQDHNHDGTIHTSQDLDYNGIINGNEILDWGKDECVIYETMLVPGSEGTYIPGNYKGNYGNYNWYFGLRCIALDKNSDVWLGNYETKKYYHINGANGTVMKIVDISADHNPYSMVIDKNGILWSAGNSLMRLDPSTGSMSIIDMGHFTYGMVYDNDDHIFLSGFYNLLSRVNVEIGTKDWTKTGSQGSRSVTVTSDGDVWTANDITHTISRFSHDGQLKATIYPGYNPIGVTVDAEGKIWALDSGDEYIHRIAPTINGVDLSKRIVGGNHYSPNLITASISKTYNRGTWTIIHDSQTDAYWGVISWKSYEPEGTGVSVRVRSSNDKTNWSHWEEAYNGAKLSFTPAGRYLEVEVTLERNGTTSPIVYNLTTKNTDSTLLTADLGVTVTGDKSSLNIGDTVKLTINVFNNGPNSANVRVNYKISFGLKLLSSQGQGTYDSGSNVWNAGVLSTGSNSTLELTLQAVNEGYFVNIFSVYGDLLMTWGLSTIGMVHAWASSGFYDPNSANNQANYNFNSNTPFNPADNSNNIPYEFPQDIQPPTPPEPKPPNHETPKPPDYGPLYPNDQLQRDITGVRDAVSRGELNKSVLPEWNLTINPDDLTLDEKDSFWLKLAGELVLGAATAVIPNEYIQGVNDAILNSLRGIETVTRYFGLGKQVKTISDAFTRVNKVVSNPAGEGIIQNWDNLMTILSPNLGDIVLERFLVKVFPGAETEIKTFMSIISTAKFAIDPFGTWNAIISSIMELMKFKIPDMEDVSKFLIKEIP